MIELEGRDFLAAGALFGAAPYGVLAAGTLEGGHPGRVFVNDPTHPQVGLICTRVGYYFLAGQPSEAQAEGLARLFTETLIPAQVENFQNPEFLLFYHPPDWAERLLKQLESLRPILIYKKRHTLPAGAQAALQGWRERIPGGMRLVPLSAALLESNADLRETAELFYGTGEDFLQRGLGVALLAGETLVCACSTVFTGAGEVEIDIHTAEGYRGRGLAFLTASAFIEACLERNLRPVWGCWPENTPSLNLARRLGFTAEADQPVCLWEMG